MSDVRELQKLYARLHGDGRFRNLVRVGLQDGEITADHRRIWESVRDAASADAEIARRFPFPYPSIEEYFAGRAGIGPAGESDRWSRRVADHLLQDRQIFGPWTQEHEDRLRPLVTQLMTGAFSSLVGHHDPRNVEITADLREGWSFVRDTFAADLDLTERFGFPFPETPEAYAASFEAYQPGLWSDRGLHWLPRTAQYLALSRGAMHRPEDQPLSMTERFAQLVDQLDRIERHVTHWRSQPHSSPAIGDNMPPEEFRLRPDDIELLEVQESVDEVRVAVAAHRTPSEIAVEVLLRAERRFRAFADRITHIAGEVVRASIEISKWAGDKLAGAALVGMVFNPAGFSSALVEGARQLAALVGLLMGVGC